MATADDSKNTGDGKRLSGENLEPRILLSVTWVGSDGDDTYSGSAGDDTLDGGLGDDVIAGLGGDDTLTGGGGFDTVDYSGAGDGVVVDLTVTTAQTVSATEGTDTLSGFEKAIGSAHDDTFAFSSPTDGASYVIEGGGGENTLDLSNYSSSDVTFAEAGLTVDLGGGESFSISYSDIATIDLSDVDATIVDGGASIDGFSGSGLFVDGADAFEVSITGSGTVDLSYDDATGTIAVTDVTSTDGTTTIEITDVAEGGGLNVGDVVLDDDIGTFRSDLDVTSITTSKSIDTITIGDGNGTLGSYTFTSSTLGDITIEADVGTLTANTNVNGAIAVQGDLTNFVAGYDFLAGGSLTVDGDVDTITVGDDLRGLVDIQGDVATIDVNDEVSGDLTIRGDLGTMEVGSNHYGTLTVLGDLGTATAGNLVGADITVSGNLTSLTTGNDLTLDGSLTVSGTVGTLAIGDDIRGDIDVQGNVTSITVNDESSGTLTFDGSVGSMTVGSNLNGSLTVLGDLGTTTVGNLVGADITVHGNLTSLVTGNDVDGALTVHGDVGTIDIGDDIDGVVTITGDVGTITIADDVKNDVTISGNVGTLDVTYNVANTIIIEGDLDNGSFDSVTGSVTVGRAEGPTVFEIGGTDYGDTYAGPTSIHVSSGGNPVATPIIEAGEDQSVAPEAVVTLGTPAGDDWDYTWTQTGGPTVTLDDPNSGMPTFTVPDGVESGDLTFEMTATTPDTDATILGHAPTDYWDFSNDDGTTASPESGDLDGTFEGDAAVGDHGATFDGAGYIEIPNDTNLQLTDGTVQLWFNTDDASSKQGLVSRDSSGYDDGGHLTVWVESGQVKVRLQSDSGDYWVNGGAISSDTWHNVAVSFGENGLELYVDGQLVDTDSYTGGIEANSEPLVIGASSWTSGDGVANNLVNHFSGEIGHFAIFDSQLSASDIAELAVADPEGNAVVDTVTISVVDDDLTPTADAGTDQTVDEGDVVTLDGTASSDPEDQSLTYTWTQTAGPSVTLDDPGAATPTFTAPEGLVNSDLTFELTVSDGSQTSTASTVTVTVNANDDAPSADAGTDQVAPEGGTLTLDASGSTDPEGQTLTYTWTQTSGPTVTLSDAGAASPTFTAPEDVANTDISFELSVSDGTNVSTSTVTVTVDANDDAPSADAGANQTAFPGDVLSLDATGSSDPDSAGLTYTWTQTSGPQALLTNATGPSPTLVVPGVQEGSTWLEFEVEISDGTTVSKDTVRVFVEPSLAGAPTGDAPQQANPDVTPPEAEAQDAAASTPIVDDPPTDTPQPVGVTTVFEASAFEAPVDGDDAASPLEAAPAAPSATVAMVELANSLEVVAAEFALHDVATEILESDDPTVRRLLEGVVESDTSDAMGADGVVSHDADAIQSETEDTSWVTRAWASLAAVLKGHMTGDTRTGDR